MNGASQTLCSRFVLMLCCALLSFAIDLPLFFWITDLSTGAIIKLLQWASCQIRKIWGCACAGNAGNVSPPPRVSDPNMHHGTCVTHEPWCMPGSLTSGFLWSQWLVKRSRYSRRMRNPQFYVSGKRGPYQRYQRWYNPNKTNHNKNMCIVNGIYCKSVRLKPRHSCAQRRFCDQQELWPLY